MVAQEQIDRIVANARLENRRPRIHYRNRANVSTLRKGMDLFERQKRLFNTKKPVETEDLEQCRQNLSVLEQQISLMKQEFELLDDYVNNRNPLQKILRANIEQLIKEFDAKIYEENMIVPTQKVFIKHNGVLVDLGTYKISISGRYNTIHIDGSRNFNGRCHPHILDGIPCLGGYGNIIPRLIKTGQWFKAYCIIVEYLHSYNPSSVYTDIERWIYEYCDLCGRLKNKCKCVPVETVNIPETFASLLESETNAAF